MARPQKTATLTAEQIQELAAVGCTDTEIAHLAGVSEMTLRRSFDTQLKGGRAVLRSDLRKVQVDRAKNGDSTMLIWLGKQYLGQRDKHELAGDPDRPLATVPLTLAQWKAQAAARRKAAEDALE
jgi:hypothetical protein